MVTPRGGRYTRRINSALDVPRHVQPTPEQSYESSTRDYINPQPRLGPLNDINFGALYRFGKENFAKNITELLKWNGGNYGVVKAKDKYGQSKSIAEDTFALNAVENIVRNKKVTLEDAKSIGYTLNKTSPVLLTADVANMINNYAAMPYLKSMLTKYLKIPKGPSTVYQGILDKFKD